MGGVGGAGCVVEYVEYRTAALLQQSGVKHSECRYARMLARIPVRYSTVQYRMLTVCSYFNHDEGPWHCCPVQPADAGIHGLCGEMDLTVDVRPVENAGRTLYTLHEDACHQH